MPKIFEYLGIIIRFYSNDHSPIHIHAIYEESEIIVQIFLKDKKFKKIVYIEKGKPMPPVKRKDLEVFVEAYKEKIVEAWIAYFVENSKVPFCKITKKIK